MIRSAENPRHIHILPGAFFKPGASRSEQVDFKAYSPFFKKCSGALLALPLLLGGCAALAPSAPAPAIATAARQYHEAIDLGGRLSVLYQQNGRDQAVHGSFGWRQDAGSTEVVLRSPLGQTVAAIAVTPQAATLTQAGQPPRSAANVDTLAEQALGWPLPVAGLRRWLQGFTGAARPLPARDDTALTDDGWRIRYDSWQSDGTEPYPKRIDLERQTDGAGTVAIRIVLDSWQPR